MVDRVTKSANQLIFNLKNTGLLDFELDKPYQMNKKSQITDSVRQSLVIYLC